MSRPSDEIGRRPRKDTPSGRVPPGALHVIGTCPAAGRVSDRISLADTLRWRRPLAAVPGKPCGTAKKNLPRLRIPDRDPIDMDLNLAAFLRSILPRVVLSHASLRFPVTPVLVPA